MPSSSKKRPQKRGLVNRLAPHGGFVEPKVKRKRKVQGSNVGVVGTDSSSAKKQKEDSIKPKDDALGLLAGYRSDSDSD